MHIFNLRETIEKTNEFIMEGKLLHAHKKYVSETSQFLHNLLRLSIMELENARDDLMFEVHKLSSEKQDYDKNVSQLSLLI